MKIGYFADGPWSHNAIDQISKSDNFEIAFIVPRYDKQDPILMNWSKKLNVDFLPIKDLNTEDSISLLSSYNADIFVSMSFNQIIKTPMLKIAKYGFINCHAGKLPFYRGCNVLNWVLINGEEEFGVTVHYMDEGIDTGDIILQETYEITDEDDYSTLLNRAAINCAHLLFKALVEISMSKAKRRKQSSIDKIGSYCRRRVVGDEFINWNQTSRQIFNFVRAITKPGPYAQSRINNKIIYIQRISICQNIDQDLQNPGTILIQNSNFLVATNNGFVKIEKFSDEEGKNSNEMIMHGSIFDK